ncbi:MAG: DinB family protein, partial [Pedobacter agri]
AKELLNEVDESIAFEKPGGQHSILELLWHMNIWKEFTISRLRPDNKKQLEYFDNNDWQFLDHSDKKLWKQGLERYYELHKELLYFIGQQKDELLSQTVSEKKYDFRKLLYGAIDHDIYHLGQIAYLKKLIMD